MRNARNSLQDFQYNVPSKLDRRFLDINISHEYKIKTTSIIKEILLIDDRHHDTIIIRRWPPDLPFALVWRLFKVKNKGVMAI
jgi:hypothetical protein